MKLQLVGGLEWRGEQAQAWLEVSVGSDDWEGQVPQFSPPFPASPASSSSFSPFFHLVPGPLGVCTGHFLTLDLLFCILISLHLLNGIGT